MIRDAVVLQQLQDEWGNVRLSQAMVKTNLAAASSGLIGGVPVTFGFRDYCHGLTLLFGFSVLENVLRQLRDEGHFSCSGWMVGPLMIARRSVLPLGRLSVGRVRKGRVPRDNLPADQVRRFA